ncbi:MAG: hypothetical protein K0S71_1293 [Clostridia bacterium]|jgi:glycosyltransferase involved in cell wall biosynthesis|nr:hypothetical protein [Clostridia bacterium]
MEKILIKLEAYSGGAPNSLLEYGKILNRLGYKVIAAGEFKHKSLIDSYNDAGIETYNFPYVNNKQVFKSIKLAFQLYNFCKNNGVTMVCSASARDTFYISRISNLIRIKYLPIIAGGNLNNKINLIKNLYDHKFICFSEENKSDLIGVGHGEENISVISNRIDVKEDPGWIKHYNNFGETINMIVISRLDSEKVKSILNAIEIAEWISNQGENIVLKIVGTGSEIENVKQVVKKTNNNFGRNIVEVLGHVDDTRTIYHDAHVIMGKGRSVIEPMMYNRIGIVIGDESDFAICNIENVEHLYFHNFSGRNILKQHSKEQLLDLIRNIRKNQLDYKSFYKVFEEIRKKYHSKYLSESFLPIFYLVNSRNDVEYTVKRFHKAHLFYIGLRYIKIAIQDMIFRRNKNENNRDI